MGIFYEQTEIINRTSKRLQVRFDGQDIELKPNYTEDGKRLSDVHNMIPTIVVPYARAQCVLMGSEDALDPSLWVSLVGIKGKHDTKFLEQSSNPTRVDLAEYLDDPSVKIELGGSRRRASMARTEKEGQMPFEAERLKG